MCGEGEPAMQVHTTTRRRLAALTLTFALLALALAPLGASARTAAPVLSASSPGSYASMTGTSCADVEAFFFSDQNTPLISLDPAVFGVAADSPLYVAVNGSYITTAMGQRVFFIYVSAVVRSGDHAYSFEWGGHAALKCLSGGVMQLSFKPDFDDYYVFPAFVMAPPTACGDLGGNARLVATITPTTGAFSFDAYAPVTLHPHALSDCLTL
jgi:hypothetical protein